MVAPNECITYGAVHIRQRWQLHGKSAKWFPAWSENVEVLALLPVGNLRQEAGNLGSLDVQQIINELIEMAGVVMDKDTNTPVSDELNATSEDGIFVCGNAFKVYDIVDWETTDSEKAGQQAAKYLKMVKGDGNG